MTDFIPGLRLSEEFWREAVAPILAENFQNVPYSAALLGSGSEVLGFDTEMSSDHHWGPRVMLFLHEADHARCHEALHLAFSTQLPHTFHGYPTHFTPPDAEDQFNGFRTGFLPKSDFSRLAWALNLDAK